MSTSAISFGARWVGQALFSTGRRRVATATAVVAAVTFVARHVFLALARLNPEEFPPALEKGLFKLRRCRTTGSEAQKFILTRRRVIDVEEGRVATLRELPTSKISQIFFALFNPILAMKGQLFRFSDGSRYIATGEYGNEGDSFAMHKRHIVDPDHEVKLQIRRQIRALGPTTGPEAEKLQAVAAKVIQVFSTTPLSLARVEDGEEEATERVRHVPCGDGIPDLLLGSRTVTLLTDTELGSGGTKLVVKGIRKSLLDDSSAKWVAVYKQNRTDDPASKEADRRDMLHEAETVKRICSSAIASGRPGDRRPEEYIAGSVLAHTDSESGASIRRAMNASWGPELEDPELYQVVELAEGDLDSVASGLSLPQSLLLFDGAIQGLALCHQAGLIHRDVKPENMLVFGTDPGSGRRVSKLSDFGAASKPRAGCWAGTSWYLPPDPVQTAEGDIWALGVTLYETIYGEPPYNRLANAHGIASEEDLQSRYDLVAKDKGSGNEDFQSLPWGSQVFVRNLHLYCTYQDALQPTATLSRPDEIAQDELKPLESDLLELIGEMLHQDPSQRPTADQVLGRYRAICKRLRDHQETIDRDNARSTGSPTVYYDMNTLRQRLRYCGELELPAGQHLVVYDPVHPETNSAQQLEFRSQVSTGVNLRSIVFRDGNGDEYTATEISLEDTATSFRVALKQSLAGVAGPSGT